MEAGGKFKRLLSQGNRVTADFELTARQWQVLTFINRFREKNQCNPTRAEIAQEFGFRSPNAAEDHLLALMRKGVIELSARSRGILVCAEWMDA
jgi:repressor LexA